MTPHQSASDSRRYRLPTSAGALLFVLVLLTAGLALAVGPAAANPAFPGRVVADGTDFATRDLTDLPAPNGNNAHSFDTLYVVQNGVADQLAVAEAAPAETDYNGGRWAVTVVAWTDGATPHELTSDDEVHQALADGDLEIIHEGVRYFESPLVPIR